MDKDFVRVGEDCQAALLMNGGDCFLNGEIARHRLGDPQSQDMPVATGDFDPRNQLERIARAPFIGPQAGFQRIMIGNGDHIQSSLIRHIIQQVSYCRKTVAGIRVHVQIGQPRLKSSLHFHPHAF